MNDKRSQFTVMNDIVNDMIKMVTIFAHYLHCWIRTEIKTWI